MDRTKRPEQRALTPLQNLFVEKTLLDSHFYQFRTAIAVAHAGESYIKSKANHKLAVRDLAAALHNVFREDLECCWIFNLLKVACDVASMVILPLNQTRDLVHESRVRNVASSLVHGSLVRSLPGGCFDVIPKRSTLVACLSLSFTFNYVENESVTWNFLVLLDFDNISTLDAPPVGDLKALVSLGEIKLLYRLGVNFFGRLF